MKNVRNDSRFLEQDVEIIIARIKTLRNFLLNAICCQLLKIKLENANMRNKIFKCRTSIL